MATRPDYTFRDHHLAAQRLTLVAETFAPLTTTLIHNVAAENPRVAIDLGCGLGHSTRILLNVAKPRRTIGLDNSERFLSVARATTSPDVEFFLHDVTHVPLPGAPADLIFCRFLLVHLANPEEHVQRWISQLAPGGDLLLQETEAIESANPVIRRYLDMVAALLQSRGADLYIGKRLARISEFPRARRTASRTTTFHVPLSLAARMFVMNIESWRDDEFVITRFGHDDIGRLASNLRDLATSDLPDTVDWTFREMAVRRLLKREKPSGC